MEIWKPVKGYESHYEVSNEGRVKSLPRKIVRSDGVVQSRGERIKTPSKNADGYLVVGMCVDGSNVKIGVHKLVAQAFVEGYFEGAEVNHIDYDRTNNSSSNLEWVTHKDNVLHSVLAGRYPSACGKYNGSKNPNYGNDTLKKRYASDKELAKEKQSRPGVKNGRAKRVRMINENGKAIDFGYIRECADYLIKNNLCNSKNQTLVSNKISQASRESITFCGMTFQFT